MTDLPPNYRWLTDKEYNKLKFRTRANVAKILSGLRRQGNDVFVDGAIEALMKLIDDTWDAVRGRDKIIKAPDFFRHYDDDKYGRPDD